MIDIYAPHIELERRRRICVSVWAYAYELRNVSLVKDHTFDMCARLIDVWTSTGNKKMDQWFLKNFDPNTGMWIRHHPELFRIEQIFEQVKNAPNYEINMVKALKIFKQKTGKGGF